MSIRPASSWPWLDDVLAEAGAFDDDPIVDAGTADDLGALVGWLDVVALDVSADVDVAAFVDFIGQPPTADDPFHFEATRRSDVAPEVVSDHLEPIDPIAAVFLEAIDSAPGFVLDERATDAAVDLAPPVGDPADAVDSTPLLGAPGEFVSFLEVETSLPDPTNDLDEDTVDDASGDLDDFDGVDGLDDFDGF